MAESTDVTADNQNPVLTQDANPDFQRPIAIQPTIDPSFFE
jgi:hypothetical protein